MIIETTPGGSRRRRGPRPALTSLLLILSGALSAGCAELLTVDNPGEILEADLRSNPAALPVLMTGVAGDFANAYGNAMLTVGHYGNELIHTGSQAGWREINLGSADPQGQMGSAYNGLVKANWVADNLADLIVESFPDAMKMAQMARARIYAGYAQLTLAATWCEVTINGGAALSPAATYQIAEGKFTEALAIATAVPNQDLPRQALAGRARARLMRGNFQGARDDARQIPKGWRFLALYSESNGTSNALVGHTIASIRAEAGVDPRFYENPLYASDPRLNFLNKGVTFRGVDRVRQFVEQTKYPNRNADAPIASWQEARLIEAEAEVKLGNPEAAILLIDELRASAYRGAAPEPLMPYDGPATAEAVLNQVLFERSVELFLEAKQFGDLRRMNSSLLTGRETCARISRTETDTNPNLRAGG